jgi:ABC-type lipoprotein release transport system permease subunit
MMFLGAGLLTGLIACILSPALSMLLAIKIHPYFKKTLKDANNTK